SSRVLKSVKLVNTYRCKYSYAFTQSNESLTPTTIGQLLEKRAVDSADTMACFSMHQNISKTYRQLNEDANKLAKGLQSIGCTKGTRVGIWSPNCYEWVVTQYATAKIGAIMVNVNPGYQAMEMDYCLNLVGCHTLICNQRFKGTNNCDILESLEPNILTKADEYRVKSCTKIPTLENILVMNSTDGEEYAPKNMIRFNEFITSFDGNNNVNTSFDFDESINIQFTSGTTGAPKGATLTHHNIMQNAYFAGKRALEGLTDKILCISPPLYHCFGSVVGGVVAAVHKGTLVLPSPVHNATETLKAIDKYKCDVVYGTPTMFIDLLNSNPQDYNTSSLKRGFMTGSPCPKPLLEAFIKAFPSCEHILIPYGTTECSPVITFTSIHDSEKHRFESVGRPLEHLEAKIMNTTTGEICPIGEAGEVCTRGHNLFAGYWNQKDKTDEVIDKNRWYHTGDIGIMDELGYISISGRLKDMIIRGGENIYPREIEDFIIKHEDVVDIQVVGIPDERMGEDLVAFVIKKTNSTLDKDSLRSYCKGKISHFKIPKNIEFVDDFPRTVTGKIEKYKLKQMAQQLYAK
ncbi:unnamed protein product, partial [Medioppia subpectinata]